MRSSCSSTSDVRGSSGPVDRPTLDRSEGPVRPLSQNEPPPSGLEDVRSGILPSFRGLHSRFLAISLVPILRGRTRRIDVNQGATLEAPSRPHRGSVPPTRPRTGGQGDASQRRDCSSRPETHARWTADRGGAVLVNTPLATLAENARMEFSVEGDETRPPVWRHRRRVPQAAVTLLPAGHLMVDRGLSRTLGLVRQRFLYRGHHGLFLQRFG